MRLQGSTHCQNRMWDFFFFRMSKPVRVDLVFFGPGLIDVTCSLLTRPSSCVSLFPLLSLFVCVCVFCLPPLCRTSLDCLDLTPDPDLPEHVGLSSVCEAVTSTCSVSCVYTCVPSEHISTGCCTSLNISQCSAVVRKASPCCSGLMSQTPQHVLE